MHSRRRRVVLIVPELWAFVKGKARFQSSRTVSLGDALAALQADGSQLEVPLPVEGRGCYAPSLEAQLLFHGLDRFVPKNALLSAMRPVCGNRFQHHINPV